MEKHRSIAILLSAYNGEKYIGEQLESLLEQDCEAEYTLLVRDDGSNDGTMEILRDRCHRFRNFEVIPGSNVGVAGSFFELLREAVARGFDYYAFCDQDDIWLPDKLSAALAILDEVSGEAPLLYGGCSFLADARGRKIGGVTQTQKRPITFFNTAIQNICPGHSQVLNHALAKCVVEHTQILEGIYSWDLWVANAAAVTGKIIFDPVPRTLYRQHGNNSLSYGSGKLSWIKNRLCRLQKNEGVKFSGQLAAFMRAFDLNIEAGQKEEIHRFFSAQHCFFSRIGYICGSHLYRQKKSETFAFRVLYVLGGYRLKEKEDKR